MTYELHYPSNWVDYALLDSGNGERLERFGSYVFRRPDPQVLWKPLLKNSEWEKAQGVFVRTREDKGDWKLKNIPQGWEMQYKHLKFWAEPTPFKHMGVFPEQAVHWDWLDSLIKSTKEEVRVLNLFGYTGLSTLACVAAGATVTHVDASRPSIGWARKNAQLSGLDSKPTRWIYEDVLSFVKREVRRGNTYDLILMDPPAFGHGAQGEVWKFHTHLPVLLDLTRQLFSPSPLGVLINAYAVSVSAVMLYNMLEDCLSSYAGKLDVGELVLKHDDNHRLLSTGIFARWSSKL